MPIGDYQDWINQQEQQGLQFPDQGAAPSAPPAPSPVPGGAAPPPGGGMGGLLQALQAMQAQQQQPKPPTSLLGAIGEIVKGAAQGFQSVAAPRTLAPAGQLDYEQRQNFEMMRNQLIYQRTMEVQAQQQQATADRDAQRAGYANDLERQRIEGRKEVGREPKWVNPEQGRHNQSMENLLGFALQQKDPLVRAQTLKAIADAALAQSDVQTNTTLFGGGGGLPSGPAPAPAPAPTPGYSPNASGTMEPGGSALLPGAEPARSPVNPPSSPGAAVPPSSLMGAIGAQPGQPPGRLKSINVRGKTIEYPESTEEIQRKETAKDIAKGQATQDLANKEMRRTIVPLLDEAEKIVSKMNTATSLPARIKQKGDVMANEYMNTTEIANYNTVKNAYSENIYRKVLGAKGTFTEEDFKHFVQAFPNPGWDTPETTRFKFHLLRLFDASYNPGGKPIPVKQMLRDLDAVGAAGAAGAVGGSPQSMGQPAGAPTGAPAAPGLNDYQRQILKDAGLE